MVLTRASNLCGLVHIETSLLPKPVKKYRKLIRDLNELLNLWSGLRAIRQNIPRKLTVLDVLPQRTELVRKIYLHGWKSDCYLTLQSILDIFHPDHIALNQSLFTYSLPRSPIPASSAHSSRAPDRSHRRARRNPDVLSQEHCSGKRPGSSFPVERARGLVKYSRKSPLPVEKLRS
jgi:hypothetical protein